LDYDSARREPQNKAPCRNGTPRERNTNICTIAANHGQHGKAPGRQHTAAVPGGPSLEKHYTQKL